MNELVTFQSADFGSLRTVEIDGEPWFVGKDVATALGYEKPTDAVRKHVDREDRGISKMETPQGRQEMAVINESGLYSLVLSSKLPTAKKFKHWVTAEVLPSIRRKGAFLTAEAAEQLNAALDGLAALAQRVEILEAQSGNRLMLPEAPPPGTPLPEPGRDARRRWFRTVNEKLELLSQKFNMTGYDLLHRFYLYVEEDTGAVLNEERLRCMEEYRLDSCSTLEAIFRTKALRENFEGVVDHNLAPENRGW